jgi:hypothetical protein
MWFILRQPPRPRRSKQSEWQQKDGVLCYVFFTFMSIWVNIGVLLCLGVGRVVLSVFSTLLRFIPFIYLRFPIFPYVCEFVWETGWGGFVCT